MKILSVNKVLEVAGGPARLQRLLWRAGQPFPSLRAVNNWKHTSVIPARWVVPIIWAFACKGVDPLRKLIVDQSADVPAPIKTQGSK